MYVHRANIFNIKIHFQPFMLNLSPTMLVLSSAQNLYPCIMLNNMTALSATTVLSSVSHVIVLLKVNLISKDFSAMLL